MSDLPPTVVLDATELNCPLPILETKKALKAMTASQVIEVMTIDPGSACDFEALCRVTGNLLLKHWEVGDVFHYAIQKGGKR